MANIEDIIQAHRIVGEKERALITGTSRSGWLTLEKRSREIGEKLVPDRIAITPGKSGWRLADLIAWVESRPKYSPAPPPHPPKKAGGAGREG